MASHSQHLDVLLTQLRFKDKARVKADLAELDRHFKSLVPRTGVLARNDGSMENVLVLGGTIPIFFGGVQYNIPLDLFILIEYPMKAPEIYIRPTSSMMIKANHKNVDMQGLVYLPYLHTWSRSSNLVQLIHSASAAFSKEPPLFSKPVNQTKPTPPPPPSPVPITARVNYMSHATNNASTNNGASTGSTSMASIYNGSMGNQQQQQQQQQYQSQSQQGSQYQTTRPISQSSVSTVPDHLKEKREKDALIDQITNMLQEEVLLAQTRMKSEIEQEFKTSQVLKQSEDDIGTYTAELISMKTAIEDELVGMERKEEQLEAWKASKEVDLTSEEISQQLSAHLKPYDDLSEQLVKLQAEHNAIDDAMYYLEKALQRGHPSMTLDVFLIKTRDLADRQFICRAHIRKIEGRLNRASGGR